MQQKISSSFLFLSVFIVGGLFLVWGNFFQKNTPVQKNIVAFQAEKRLPVITVPKKSLTPETITVKNTPSTTPLSARKTKTS